MAPGLVAGEIIADRYRIEAEIGQGGMGTVYRAAHLKLPRRFAVKLLRPELAADTAFVMRFKREAVAASRVLHPGVVNVTDFGQLPDGSYYLAMEYLEGDNLEQVLEREGRLTLPRTLEILLQLAAALEACHQQGIVHRDLKTENILLCREHGREDVVKLVDFGIARLVGPGLTHWRITTGGTIFGTPEYISPERARDQDIDGRADIYALGIIGYELVTGAPPFTGRYTEILKAHLEQEPAPPSSHCPEPLPPAFDAMVLRCLAKEPAQRYGSCREMVGELAQLRGRVAGALLGLTGRTSAGRELAARITTSGAWTTVAQGSTGTPIQPDLDEGQLERLTRLNERAAAAAFVRQELRHALKELSVALPPAGDGEPATGLSRILDREAQAARLERELLETLQLQSHQRLASTEQLQRARELVADQQQLLPADSRGAPELDNLRELRDQRRADLAQVEQQRDRECQRCEAELRTLYQELDEELLARCPAQPHPTLRRLLDQREELNRQLLALLSES